ncbi:MAG TPA: hypothetical protein VGK73_16790 [Polyangiaceae bacterium]
MTTKRAAELAQRPSDWALRELPARVALFLRAAGSHAPLRALLKRGGYGPEDHAEGLRLFAAAFSYREGGLDPAEDAAPRAAAAELETWAKTHLGRLRAALERIHPEWAAIIPPDTSRESAEAVLAVATLLERLTELEEQRTSQNVLATLARRGFHRVERRRLSLLVETARAARNVSAASTTEPTTLNAGHAREPPAEIVALQRWYDDWSSTARALVPRRDWLIRMGLVERRRAKG